MKKPNRKNTHKNSLKIQKTTYRIALASWRRTTIRRAQHYCWIVCYESHVKYSQEKQEVHLNRVEGIILLVLFLFYKLTKMYGRILRLFLRGEGKKGSSRKQLKCLEKQREVDVIAPAPIIYSWPCLFPCALICGRVSLTSFSLQVPFSHQAVSVSITRIQGNNVWL